MRLSGVVLFLAFSFTFNNLSAQQIQVTNVRLWKQTEPQSLRMVLNLNAPVVYRIFALKFPHRLVIDLDYAHLIDKSIKLPAHQELITKIRSAPREDNGLRIVLDLEGPVTKKNFLLKPSGRDGHRLVIDIHGQGRPQAADPIKQPIDERVSQTPPVPEELPVSPMKKESANAPAEKVTMPVENSPVPAVENLPAAESTESANSEKTRALATESLPNAKETTLLEESVPAVSETDVGPPIPPEVNTSGPLFQPEKQKRDIVVAIDAGHGGIDPGATGQDGVQEKDVVLAIAEALMTFLAQEENLRPVLIRKGDYFLPLRKRIELARKYRADLLVSIHADAYPDPNTRGSSVYMLSRQGASSEAAKWLAERENNADLIGGVSLSDKDELLASVLLDLSQTGALTASAYAGQTVLKALKNIGATHYKYLQRAGFIVLRAPDVPSILVEVGFISNPAEEQTLNDNLHRLRVAHALAEGIKAYFTDYAPLDSLLARR